MRVELAALRAEVAELRARPAEAQRDDIEPTDLQVTSRRRLFALAGGAAAAAVVVATASSSAPAAAANGDNVTIANNTVASATKVISTFLNYSAAINNVDVRNLFVAGDDAAAFSPAVPAAVSGYAAKVVTYGVLGTSTRPGGSGVVGYAPPGTTSTTSGVYGVSQSGIGVAAESLTGLDLYCRGTGRLRLGPALAAGPPVGSFNQGELVRDGNGDLFFCYAGGATSSWRKLGGVSTAGALHIIEPTRVYDSRLAGAGGPINSAEVRTVSVANGINISTGVVTVNNLVPAGATAIQFTFTIANATTQGFLAVTPGDAAEYKASAINWSSTTPNLASGSLVKVAADRTVKVWAGGGGSTQFIIDITGYYL